MICLPVTDYSVKIGSLDSHEFKFDKVFMPNATQNELFEFVGRPIVEDIMAGYNGTVLAYGQTGSGKTFTMMGGDEGNHEGLIPKAAHQIFETILQSDPQYVFTITCSMLEIYKETLRDLLDPSDIKLSIKTNEEGVYIDGLSEDYIGDEDELMERIAFGQANRTVAATKMNARSSRSHQLFVLKVSQKLPDGMEKAGILNLVDLAGSEKVTMSGVTGNKLEEAKKINLSLSMLGNVIHSLSSGASHIPYRDSKLTRILQESLGGNFKTCLVVTASPHVKNIEETISTLKFAQRAKTIKNKAVLNVKETPEVIIARLKKQLEEAYSYIELLKKSMMTCPVDGPLGVNPFEVEKTYTKEGSKMEIEFKEGDSKVEGGSSRDEEECQVRSIHSFQIPGFDIDKNWEALINQHESDLEVVKNANKKLNNELEDLRRKLRISKTEKRNCERQMMEMATKAKQLSDKQVYLVEDMQKDERIQQLSREVESLKRMLRDSLGRASFGVGEKQVEIVEFEEELSLVRYYSEFQRVIRVRDIE